MSAEGFRLTQEIGARQALQLCVVIRRDFRMNQSEVQLSPLDKISASGACPIV